MPQHKTVLIEESGVWREIGMVERTDDFLAAIRSSESVLGRTIESGMFECTTSSDHVRVDYVESVADWDEYLSKGRTKGFSGDTVMLDEVLRRLEAGDECLRMHTGFHVAKYVVPGALG